MSTQSEILERYKLQTYDLKPDKYVHLLNGEQAGGAPATVLYKKRGGSAGQLGGGSFGAVHLQDADSDVGSAPRVRAVKSISKDVTRANKIHWEQEVENLIVLSRVRICSRYPFFKRSSCLSKSQFPDLFVIIYGWWEDEKFIYLPMEYFAAGDLSNCKESIRSEADIRTISCQIGLGLLKMHGFNIIHRDLKPHVEPHPIHMRMPGLHSVRAEHLRSPPAAKLAGKDWRLWFFQTHQRFRLCAILHTWDRQVHGT